MFRIPILTKIINRLLQISRVVKQERSPRVAFFRAIAWLIGMVEGKVLAYFVGWKKAYVGRGSRVIGTRFITVQGPLSVGRYAWIEAVAEYGGEAYCPAIKFGEGFHASERLHISAINRIEIGDNCLFGSCIYVSDHNHGAYKGSVQSSPLEDPIARRLVSFGPVIIGSNVWLGDNVVIIGPVKIGNGVVIGANSVVTKDIPDRVVATGAPAKVLKYFNDESEKWEKSER